jgi:putative endonuclease
VDRLSKAKQSLGRWGEAQAAEYLHRQGYEIVEMNHRTAYGEIDIVARQAGELVFVEVKTRTRLEFGYPEAAVNQDKQAHLLASVQAYMQENPEIEGVWRVDVIAILRRAGQDPEILHFENVLH